VPLDPQAAAYLDWLREQGDPPYPELGPEASRRVLEARLQLLFGDPDPVESVEDVDAGGVPARVYDPGGNGAGLVYFHGGGWVLGSLASHDALCRTLAARSGWTVVAVDYRLAPEHRHPAALEDAWAATRWAAERWEPLAVAGDSAGGHLAAVVAVRARDAGLRLSHQVLIYPVTDCDFETPSYREHGVDTTLTTITMRWFWDQYLPDAQSRTDCEAAPLRAPDVAGVAPALVITAEYDPLCDEGEAYARKLTDAGVPVVLRRYEGQMHGFVCMPGRIDRAWDAIDEIAGALRAGVTQPDAARNAR
jgi:acetyl esterase/lipase